MSQHFRFSAVIFGALGASFVALSSCGGEPTGGSLPSAGSGGSSGGGGSGGTVSSGGKGGSGGTGDSGGSSGTTGEAGGGGTDPGSGGSGGSSGGKGGSSGSGGSKAGSGGSGASTTDDLLDEIEGHCERDCAAQYALACAPANSNRLVCELSCAATTAQLGDFCLREYADVVKCRADGGYDCLTETQPYPNSTCAVQSLALNECTQHLGCKRGCATAIAEGCTDESLSDCIDGCIAEVESLPDRCQSYGDSLETCKATLASPTCDGERLATPESCNYYVLNIADCIGDQTDDPCEGWCYAAEQMGCAQSDCLSDCQAKSEDVCGSEYTSMIDCALLLEDAECTDGELVAIDSCSSNADRYQTCLDGQST